MCRRNLVQNNNMEYKQEERELKCLPTSLLSVCCVSDYDSYNRIGKPGSWILKTL